MSVKTINLTGAETAVSGLDGANAAIRNDGTDIIYVSAKPGITPGADGVLSIPAGGSAVVYSICGAVYLLGTGSATIVSSDYNENPFRSSTASGGSTVDEVARTALSAHEGNAEIHLTAEQAQAAAAQVCSNPNLLINPDFSVNQRGLSEYTSGYCVDCWRIIVPDIRISILPRGIKIGYGTDTTPPAAIKQTIERYQALAGKTITASVYIPEKNSEKANLSINYLINGTRQYKTKLLNEGINTFTVSIPDDIEDLQFWIYGADVRTGVDTTDSYSVVEWAKLEIGSAATPYSPPDPATELAKCQRYYQIRSTGDIPEVDLRPTMRSTPTVTQISDGNYAYSAEL